MHSGNRAQAIAVPMNGINSQKRLFFDLGYCNQVLKALPRQTNNKNSLRHSR